MVENNFNKEPSTRLETPQELTPPPRPAGAPWWLVIVLMLGLGGMAAYIAWMNSATLKNRMGYITDFMKSRNSEAELVSPTPSADSVAAWENSLLNSGTLATDSETQDWKSDSEPTQEATNPETGRSASTAPGFGTPAPVSEAATPVASGYYIKAGEFTSRRAAQFRVSELRQGNYWGKIIEPDSAGGTYIVSVGEFTSFNKAKEKARTIGFIMDIRTSVVKTE